MGIPNLAFFSDIGARQIQTMSFHRSKLEMNRRLDFRTGGGYLLIQKLICLLWVVAACCKGGLPIYSCIRYQNQVEGSHRFSNALHSLRPKPLILNAA